MDALDTDVLIYAAEPGHDLGRGVARLVADGGDLVGSVLLLPELLVKPTRLDGPERARIVALLAHVDLVPLSGVIASHAVTLGARYALHVGDAVHLATAVDAGADRFITNNRRDFKKDITEIDIVYPDEL